MWMVIQFLSLDDLHELFHMYQTMSRMLTRNYAMSCEVLLDPRNGLENPSFL